MASLLEVRDLRTSFRTSGGVVQAVRGVDLRVSEGEFLGIVGESGCGKSVSMLSVMRLLEENARVKAAEISFNGKNLLALSRRAMRQVQGAEIGMIFQDPMTCLNPLFTIGNQLSEPLRLHLKLSRRQARERAAEMLEMVGIPDPQQRLRAYPHEFSGGMRQRVMIAIAVACHPRLLIADEPTTALDVTIQAQILDLMASLKERFSMATILITHDLGVIASTCRRVVVMYGGLVMEEGLLDDIFYRPLHPYTRGLLASVPNVGSDEVEKLTPIPGSPPDLLNPPAGCPFAARCEEAMRICARYRPPLRAVSETQSAACWLLSRENRVQGTAGSNSGGEASPLAPKPNLPHSGMGGLGFSTTPLSGGEPPATPPGAGNLLSVQNLSVHFPVKTGAWGKKGVKTLKAVDGVSFAIRRGETFGLVGESGCGKTTTGRAILKLHKPSGGRVIYDGEDISGLDGKAFFPWRRRMQMIFQDPYTALDPRQPVSEIIGAPLLLHNIVSNRRLMLERVYALLEMVGLKRDHANRYPHEFSGGQRQRIGIARALGLSPQFIICDEPISALDVSIQAQIINMLQEFQEAAGLTYLFISHDLTMVRHLSHNVGVMYLGNLVEVADVDEIYDHTCHPYTQSLFSAAPIADPVTARKLHRVILQGDVPSPLDPPSGCPFRGRCALSTERCAAEKPPLEDAGGGHLAACWNKL